MEFKLSNIFWHYILEYIDRNIRIEERFSKIVLFYFVYTFIHIHRSKKLTKDVFSVDLLLLRTN